MTICEAIHPAAPHQVWALILEGTTHYPSSPNCHCPCSWVITSNLRYRSLHYTHPLHTSVQSSKFHIMESGYSSPQSIDLDTRQLNWIIDFPNSYWVYQQSCLYWKQWVLDQQIPVWTWVSWQEEIPKSWLWGLHCKSPGFCPLWVLMNLHGALGSGLCFPMPEDRVSRLVLPLSVGVRLSNSSAG